MLTGKLAKSRRLFLSMTFLFVSALFLLHVPEQTHAQLRSDGDTFIRIRVNCLEIRSLPADVFDGEVAQLQFMVFVSDGDRIRFTLNYYQDAPDAQAPTIRAGQRFCNTDAYGAWFAIDQARDQVAVWFLAVDNDDLSQLLSTALDGTGSLLADAFKTVIDTSGAISVLSRANLLALALELVLGRAVEAWEIPDTIGQYQTVLLRQQDWNLGSYRAVSPDGNLVIEYDVLLTNEQPQDVPETSTAQTVLPNISFSTVVISTAEAPCPGRRETGADNWMTLQLNVPDGYVQYLIGSRFDNTFDGVLVRVIGPYQAIHRLYNGMFCEPVPLSSERAAREHALAELATGGQTCELGDCPIEIVCRDAVCRRQMTNEQPQDAPETSTAQTVLPNISFSTVVISTAEAPCPGRRETGAGNWMTLQLNVPDGYVQYLIGSRFDNTFDGVLVRVIGPYQAIHRLYNGMFCEPVTLSSERATREHALAELATGGQTCELGDCPIEIVCRDAVCRRQN